MRCADLRGSSAISIPLQIHGSAERGRRPGALTEGRRRVTWPADGVAVRGCFRSLSLFAANGLCPVPLRNGSHEQAHLSALQHPSPPHASVPRPHEDAEWPRGPRSSPRQGSRAPVGDVGQQEGLSRPPCAASPTAGRPVPNRVVRHRGHLPPRVARGGFCRGPRPRGSASVPIFFGSSPRGVVGPGVTSRLWS